MPVTKNMQSDDPAEAGAHDGFDPKALRRTLGQFATGVTVVTAADPETGEVVGMTANSFASVSLEPPLVLWSIVREAKSLPVFMKATHFAINILAKDQLDHSNRFARPGADKFVDVDWTPGLGGAPVLGQTAAVFECARHAEHDGGDHIIMLGRVDRFARFDRDVLVFSQGRYGVTAEHPLADGQPAAPGLVDGPHPYDDFLIPLLHRAYSSLYDAFFAELGEEGISGPDMRVLAYLSLRPGSSAELVSRGTYLGSQIIAEVLDKLRGKTLVTGDPETALHLTETGTVQLKTLIDYAQRFEMERLGTVDAVELATLKRLLRRLTENETDA